MTSSPTKNNSSCTFPRLTLHACALTRTISLSYRGISLSFYLVTEVFQLVTCYFTFPVRFQLNSDFFHTFLNGQLTRRTIKLKTYKTVKVVLSCLLKSGLVSNLYTNLYQTTTFLHGQWNRCKHITWSIEVLNARAIRRQWLNSNYCVGYC